MSEKFKFHHFSLMSLCEISLIFKNNSYELNKFITLSNLIYYKAILKKFFPKMNFKNFKNLHITITVRFHCVIKQ